MSTGSYFARGARVRSDGSDDDGLDVSGLLDAGLLYAALKTHPNDADMLGKCCIDGVGYKVAAYRHTARNGRAMYRLKFSALRTPPPREVPR
jgi:hypothetical protein